MSIGSASERGYGGPVTVTVTVEDGEITGVEAEGGSETDGFGSLALEKLPAAMTAAGSVKVDAVAGATITSEAILAAAERALAAASGGGPGAADGAEDADGAGDSIVRMAPGEYTNSVWAFSFKKKMTVTVKVDDQRILGIYISDNGEYTPVLRNAKQLLIPRILESQSISVDAISGATGTSNGIRNAVTRGLKQALAAAGSPESAIRRFRKPPEMKPARTEVLECDVLVIGMGGTGSAAAMSAAETQKAMGRPVSVLAIEKAGKYGGTSALTSEMMAVNPPRFMKEHNNEVASMQLGTFVRPLDDVRTDKSVYVDREELKRDWMAYTRGDAKEELIDLMLDESGKTLDWLRYEHGFFFGKPQFGVEPSAHYYLVYQYNGSFMDNKHVIAGYFDQLWHDYESLGGRYLLETEALGLLVDDDGGICGARARRYDGLVYTIRAKAVVIGTGGFAGNGEMTTELLREDYFPLKGKWRLVGMSQNDGKMIQSALDNGAGTYNISVAPITHIGGPRYYYHAYETRVEKMAQKETGEVRFDTVTKRVPGEEIIALDDVPQIMTLSGNVISVNRFGKRFVNERGLGFLQPWRGGVEFYSLWTHKQIERVRTTGFDFVQTGSFVSQGGVPVLYPIENIFEIVKLAMEMGEAYKGDTVGELAAALRIDPATLLVTIRAYNGYCETGVDEEYGKETRYLRPFGEDEGPFYAFLGAPYCYSTTGGLDVNGKLQVLKKDGVTPLRGLYAAGTDCLGTLLTEKDAYVTYGGLAQGWAFTSGRIAGENAAGEAAVGENAAGEAE